MTSRRELFCDHIDLIRAFTNVYRLELVVLGIRAP